jgi:imidazole glycerol-phosphate synthase subunit HisF
MVLAKRIIPCLDVKDGRVVKGRGFTDLQDAGDPVERAVFYYKEGADEVMFLDITASHENRKTMVDVVSRTSEQLYIPFTVGGGISSIEDIDALLHAGAEKVGINTAAIKNPEIIKEASRIYGAQCVVSSIDVKRVYLNNPVMPAPKDAVILNTPEGKCWWTPVIYGGRTLVGIDAITWSEKAVALGAGELVVSSLDTDGMKKGYDNICLAEMAKRVSVPIIASSGAGNPQHMLEAFTIGHADAALAASIFHYGQYTVRQVKEFIAKHGIPMRL